ncbi:hypothetical protein CEXT_714251 [Caerostris extrusa]|uniref:Uncharacterized protein n=1 Tax=Caerostris extrusa TaxID=172846 RepID=A0AAV4N6Z5_CAEEX|nr:hypothetical protein CEXT_714251 [Caerostris extrusa]
MNSDDDTIDDPNFYHQMVQMGYQSADEETLEDSTQNENPDIEYLWSESQQPNKKRKLQSSWVATKKEIGIPQEIGTTNVGTHMEEKGKHTKSANNVAPKTNQKRTKVLCSTCKGSIVFSSLFYVVLPE